MTVSQRWLLYTTRTGPPVYSGERKAMKVYVIFEDGTDEEINILPGNCTPARAIELAKIFLAKRNPPETRKVKSFEVEEDFV
jgi:hypothetical protein